jgi:hypothetical protein
MAVLKVAHLDIRMRQIAEPVSPKRRRPEGAADRRHVRDHGRPRWRRARRAAGPRLAAHRRYGLRENPRYPEAAPIPLTVLVNPRITPLGTEQEEGWEGCLSVPDMRGMVPRFQRVQVDAYGRDGRPFRYVVDGFHARVVQHECDHLDGKVYIDRMRSTETLTCLPEFQRYWLEREE